MTGTGSHDLWEYIYTQSDVKMFRLEGKQKGGGGGDTIGAEARISENVLNVSLNNVLFLGQCAEYSSLDPC